jgi:DNA recombination protein RmuC
MTFDLVHAALLILVLAAIAFALWSRRDAAPQLARLETELDRERKERAADVAAHKAERTELTKQAETLRARAEAAEQKAGAQAAQMGEREAALAREREHMAKVQADTESRFRALASEALQKSQEQFIKTADETLKKHKEGAAGELGKLLQPIQETFGQFREKVAEIEKVRSEDRARLDEQLKSVGETARLAAESTTKLSSALSSTRGAGRWGEGTLRNVLEIAGLSPHADFTEQTSANTETGKIRPDVIINMPGGRCLVIDSKCSLEDYLAAAEENDPARRKQKLAAHAVRVKAHVTSLSRKDYWKDIPATVDFVVMFLPGENFYSAVLEHDREIFDYAWRNNVMIATPATLIALAKSVAYGWRQEQMAANAEQAAKLGRELHDRLMKMFEHMTRVGGGITNAAKAYNDMVGSFEGRVLPAARKFEELQFADAQKTIETPPQVEIATRQLSLLEGAAETEKTPRRKTGV